MGNVKIINSNLFECQRLIVKPNTHSLIGSSAINSSHFLGKLVKKEKKRKKKKEQVMQTDRLLGPLL